MSSTNRYLNWSGSQKVQVNLDHSCTNKEKLISSLKLTGDLPNFIGRKACSLAMNNKKREEEYKLRLKLANQEIDELKTTLKVIEKDFVSDKTICSCSDPVCKCSQMKICSVCKSEYSSTAAENYAKMQEELIGLKAKLEIIK